MSELYDIVIVGGGHAGAQAAITLRQVGFLGTIAIVGEELELPYERPPLSKEYLAGEKQFARILLRPEGFWPDRGIAMLLGRRITAVDAVAHQVIDEAGNSIGYGRLVWATGGAPRRLTCAGHALPGVHTVRNRADVDRMMDELPQVRSAVVIGGGFIGLEAAAALSQAGKRVTLLEALDRVLARVAGERLSRFFETEHRAHGVDIRLSQHIACIEGANHVTGVRLDDGSILPADMVIVGIGIVPAVEPLLAAGAKGGNGVTVDAGCRTSLPDIWAIGDCALHVNRFAAGASIRLESVQNANDQATVAAKVLMGMPADYDAVPWFWSNQYDLKLQTIGISTDHDVAVIRGDPATRSFSIVYFRDGHVIALDCVNAIRDYVQGRKLVENGRSPDPARVSDLGIALKDLCI